MEFVRHTAALSRRSIVRFARQPSTWIPGVVFPLLLAAVNSSAVSRATEIGGFPPGTTYLQFLLPAAILQGVMFGAIAGGTELATDIQTGFFERLLSSPVSRPAILIGRLAGATVFGVFQGILFIGVLWPFGARVEGGVAGALVLVAVGGALSLGAGAFSAGLAARTGQPEAVQGFFPLVFIGLFLSSCFFPTQLMSGWYRWVAERNPLTWMADGIRYQVIVGFDLGQAGRAFAVVGVVIVVGLAFATSQIRHRWSVAG